MVIVNAYAFDKDSSAMCGQQIRSESKEDFNAQMKEFEQSIPFRKYYTELLFDEDELTQEQQSIVEDYEVVSKYF
jgi:hypothetical protein